MPIVPRLMLAGVIWLTLAAAPVQAQVEEPLDETLRMRVETLALDPRIDDVPVADAQFLIRFYERREFSPAWSPATKLRALIAVLADSPRHGLDPDDYHVDWLIAQTQPASGAQSAIARANLDLLATDALARYAFHLRFGKVNPEELEPSWNFSRSLAGTSPVDAVQRLVAAPDLAAALDALAPREARYRELMRALDEHRQLAASGGWPRVSSGETLRPGMRSARVAELRHRLQMSGDLATAETEDPERFDAALDAAVRAFQERHGLEPDGVVGPRSLAALNVPVEARIDQLRVNLERVRWIFRDLEDRYIIANIARLKTTLVENGAAVWSARSVVGRPYRQTPVFRARMTYLVLNPTWTVPPGILRQDLLPEIRRDPAVLAQRNMTVLDTSGRPVDPAAVDWSGVRGFPYTIRQEPGSTNALGRVKFMFPNQHHVYMHDTPATELFARADRTFSSGCIRLDQPLELARLLLAETGQWDEAAIERTLAAGRPRTVALPRPLTVLLIYGTAVPEEGRVLFLPDIYDRDARLLAALDDEFTFSPPEGYDPAFFAAAH